MTIPFKSSDGIDQLCRAFWRGATHPSLSALLIALAIVVVIFGTYSLLLTQEVFANFAYRYFMASELDTHTNTSRKALSIAPSDSPIVAIVGTSVTIRCVEAERKFAQKIGVRSGEQPIVYDLSTDAQTTWEMAALIERIPADTSGVLVVGITPGVLSFGIDDGRYSSLAQIIEHPKLGITSKALDDEARRAGIKVPVRTGIHSLDNSYFILAHRRSILRNLLRGGYEYGDPLTAPWMKRVNDPKVWQEEIDSLPEKIVHYEINHNNNLSVIERLVSSLKARADFSVIIMESPVNPRWNDDPVGRLFFKRYREDLQSFAARSGFSFIPATDQAGLQIPDFVDYEGHIGTPQAREKCTDALVKSIVKELKR